MRRVVSPEYGFFVSSGPGMMPGGCQRCLGFWFSVDISNSGLLLGKVYCWFKWVDALVYFQQCACFGNHSLEKSGCQTHLFGHCGLERMACLKEGDMHIGKI